MRKVYLVLAWMVVAEVVIQAGSIALGMGAMSHHMSEGGVVDKASLEDGELSWVGEIGFPIHYINGGLVVPVLALVLLLVSFFAHVERGRRAAALVFVLVLVQGSLGYSITDSPYVGAIHGANALAVFGASLYAARLARSSASTVVAAKAYEDARS